MSPHKQKENWKLNNKKQSIIKIAQIKINRKIKDQNKQTPLLTK